MAGQSKRKITDKDITGLKYFEKLLPLFERLHEVGCDRDTAGNRDLHFDEYCCLVLLFFFNPMVDSLRALQQASELKAVQEKVGRAARVVGIILRGAAGLRSRIAPADHWRTGETGTALGSRSTAERLDAVANAGGWHTADGAAAHGRGVAAEAAEIGRAHV